ncbi:MAG TPA: hypothetical protein VF754_05485 [Pyrinomonadaceae bacterium]
MKSIFVAFLLAAAVLSGTTPFGAGVAAQCKRVDTPRTRELRFARGRTTAVVKDTIRLCTSHEYRLRARSGQTMSVNLVAGERTGLTLYTPGGETLVDGGKEWSGELPESGQYVLSVGTDATARYTLEVNIR